MVKGWQKCLKGNPSDNDLKICAMGSVKKCVLKKLAFDQEGGGGEEGSEDFFILKSILKCLVSITINKNGYILFGHIVWGGNRWYS